MIDITITIPFDSLPGVEVEARYETDYHYMDVDIDTSNLALVFQGSLVSDSDYEEKHDWHRTRPAPGNVKLSKPRLKVVPHGD
jgi:hypothetical protein